MNKKRRIIGSIIIVLAIIVALIYVLVLKKDKEDNTLSVNTKVDIKNLTKTVEGKESSLKVYKQDDYESFVNDFKNNNLDDVYVTEFLYDGVGLYKDYDLDDFIENGNDYEVKTYDGTVINIKDLGTYELTGELTGGMIAVNTNELKGDINLLLNNIKLDTDSKKVPAIYVYNKDITYSDCKVNIVLKEDTKNYITGGKFKKVSLIGSDELSNYTSKYSGDASTWYNTYTNYYGIYTSDEIKNILFGTVEADNEGLRDGDPVKYYKGSGAISSDIDLTFKGSGSLELTSNKKEGIETKGNLTLGDGSGDYIIYALDDCLNTTTDSSSGSNVRNTLTIDVNSLITIVLEDADEGDAIDSNGDLIINNGTIIALAHPGQDAGIDGENGTTINGGTILSTGDMYDQIKSDSKQNFIVLSFGQSISANTLITLLDSNDNLVFSYKTDRVYSNLVFSSSNLTNGTYTLYKDGEISGDNTNGLYLKGEYTRGTQLGYTSTGTNMGGPGMGEMPNDGVPQDGNTPPEKPDGDMGTPPNSPSGERREMPSEGGNTRPDMNNQGNQGMTVNATNKDFTIEGISNAFSGIAELVS